MASLIAILTWGIAADASDPLEDARYLEDVLGTLTRSFESGHPDSVLAGLEEVGRSRKLTARLWNLAGLSHAALGDPEAAIAAYEAGIRLAPGRSELHVNLATTLVQSGRTGRALAEFEEATRLDSENVDGWLGYGRLLTRFRRWEPAREALDFARRLAPGDPRVLVARAELLETSRGGPVAIEAWSELDAVAPSAESARRLGRLTEAESGSEAARHYRDCLERDAAAIDCREAAARLLLLDGRALECRRLLEPALADLSDAGYQNLMLSLDALNAVSAMEELVGRRTPAWGTTWGVLGARLREAGRLEAGLAATRRGRAIDSADDALANLEAALLYDLGHLSEAREIWRAIVARSPEDETARANLENSQGP